MTHRLFTKFVIAMVFGILFSASGYAAEPTRVDKVMDFLGEKGVEYVNALEELTKQYTPDVINAAITVTRVKGIQELAYTGLSLLLVIVSTLVGWVGVRRWAKERWRDGVWIAPAVIGGVGGVFSWMTFLINVSDVWMWVAIFEPKLYIAKQIMSAVLK